MEKTGQVQELSSISGLFISAQEEKKATSPHIHDLSRTGWGQPREDCEVEETVTVRKRVAYRGVRNGHENIKKSLFGLLQEGYSISRIELTKTSETLKPGNRTVTNEEISLYLK